MFIDLKREKGSFLFFITELRDNSEGGKHIGHRIMMTVFLAYLLSIQLKAKIGKHHSCGEKTQ